MPAGDEFVKSSRPINPKSLWRWKDTPLGYVQLSQGDFDTDPLLALPKFSDLERVPRLDPPPGEPTYELKKERLPVAQLTYIDEGTDDVGKRTGRKILLRSVEFKLHIRAYRDYYDARVKYTVPNIGNPRDEAVYPPPEGGYPPGWDYITQGAINAGYVVPDSGPQISGIYPANPAAPDKRQQAGYCVVRAVGGTLAQNANNVYPALNASEAPLDGSDQRAQVTYPGNFGSKPLNGGGFMPTGGTPPSTLPNVLVPANITVALGEGGGQVPGWTYTPPSMAGTDAATVEQSWQTYGPRGYTVPPSLGSVKYDVPEMRISRGPVAQELDTCRILIVYDGAPEKESPLVVKRPSITEVLDVVQGPSVPALPEFDIAAAPFVNTSTAMLNMTNRERFEIVYDGTFSAANQWSACVIEHGVTLDRHTIYDGAGPQAIATGALWIYLLSPARPDLEESAIIVERGNVRLYYEED